MNRHSAGVKFNMFIAEGANVLPPGSNTTAIDLLASEKVAFVNNGSVFGSSSAIRTGTSDAFSYFNLQNAGAIEGGSAGIWFANQAGNTAMQNSGTIQGGAASYRGSDGDDSIANTGSMIGSIQLNGGNDSYRGAAGVVEGNVYGGAGDDKLIGGLNDDAFSGGDDDDILHGNGGMMPLMAEPAMMCCGVVRGTTPLMAGLATAP